MGVIFIAIHLVIALLSCCLKKTGILRVDKMMMVVVLFIPLFGALAALIVSYINTKGLAGDRNCNIEPSRDNSKEDTKSVAPVLESANAVPLEDALLIDDASVRRSVILDVLMNDTKDYLPVLDQARMNDDVEVVHYATTAMAELSKEFELKLQEFSNAYDENPDRAGLLDEYIEFLEQYISSNLIQGQLLEIQRVTYLQLLYKKASIEPDFANLSRLTGCFLDLKQSANADNVLRHMEKKWPMNEEVWKLRFRYCYEIHAGEKMSEMINTVKNSGDFYSREIKEIVSLWDKMERVAEA